MFRSLPYIQVRQVPNVLALNNFSVLKGNKPDFHNAMGGEQAKKLFDLFLSELSAGLLLDAAEPRQP